MDKQHREIGVARIDGGLRPTRLVQVEGPMASQVGKGLASLGNDLREVFRKARLIVERLPDPYGPPTDRIGLMLGRIQAGKTNAMIATTAVAVDNGYKVVVVLTSDNTWLYEQTLGRFKKSLPGISCAGYSDWESKRGQIESAINHGAVALITTKNGKRLQDLVTLLKTLKAQDLPALVFDDEADQASLNTNAQRPHAGVSRINGLITKVRKFFHICGFLQVTATPQALLLQDKASPYRPQFTVVLEPGSSYVGGSTYFADKSPYLKYVPLDEISGLKKDTACSLPSGLGGALATFFVAATAKLIEHDEQAYSCLVHVSLKTQDHDRLRDIIQSFIDLTAHTLRGSSSPSNAKRVRTLFSEAYDNLKGTFPEIPPFEAILRQLGEMVLGTDVQVLNSANQEKQARYDSRYNILIGGTKLGRGVTIQGLLVTYYGRESKSPQMDTVQQHARMYGYRRSDLPLSRIYLPEKLAQNFRAINLSENELRDWLKTVPDTPVDPQIIPSDMKATRSNVLNPAMIGCYVPGVAYTPGPFSFVGYNDIALTTKLDGVLGVPTRGNVLGSVASIDDVIQILMLVQTKSEGSGRWEDQRVRAALTVLSSLCSNDAYVAVFGGRRLRPNEKPNVADSDDLKRVPKDVPALLMFRQDGRKQDGWEDVPFWIPVVRFPDGKYPVCFNFS